MQRQAELWLKLRVRMHSNPTGPRGPGGQPTLPARRQSVSAERAEVWDGRICDTATSYRYGYATKLEAVKLGFTGIRPVMAAAP
jgi:hypothetical protein